MIQSKKLSPVHKLTISAMVMALYVVIMIFTQSFSFMQNQMRIATSFYSFSAIFPFLIFPLGLSNMLSNIFMGSLGPIDYIGGFAVGTLTSAAVYLIKRFNLNDVFISLPIIFIPGLLVPVWLSFLLNIPYSALAISLCVGQIVPGVFGVVLVKVLKRIKLL